MIKLTTPTSKNKKVNRILQVFLSDRLYDSLMGQIETLMKCPYDKIVRNRVYAGELEYFFPQNYPATKRADIIDEVIKFLRSEEELQPKLIIQYVLSSVIEIELNACELSEQQDRENNNELENFSYYIKHIYNREYVVSELYKEYQNESKVMSIVRSYEDIRYYNELCFKNNDFMALDEMYAYKIRKLEEKEEAKLENEIPERFFIFPDWYQNKS